MRHREVMDHSQDRVHDSPSAQGSWSGSTGPIRPVTPSAGPARRPGALVDGLSPSSWVRPQPPPRPRPAFAGAVVAYGAIQQSMTDLVAGLSDQVRAYGRDQRVEV